MLRLFKSALGGAIAECAIAAYLHLLRTPLNSVTGTQKKKLIWYDGQFVEIQYQFGLDTAHINLICSKW